MYQRTQYFIYSKSQFINTNESSLQLEWENQRKRPLKETSQRRVRNRKFDYLDLLRHELDRMCCLLPSRLSYNFVLVCSRFRKKVHSRCQYKAFFSQYRKCLWKLIYHTTRKTLRAAGWALKKRSVVVLSIYTTYLYIYSKVNIVGWAAITNRLCFSLWVGRA